MRQIKIAVHGGAGTMPKRLMTPEIEKACHDALQNALQAGYDLMKNGGSAFDAVEAAIIILENFELFNAGKGAVFTHDGKHEMDASIMDGKTLRSGAVAAVNNIKNPISLAKAVMLHSEHVLLLGSGAEVFAKQQNIVFETDDYFFTQFRYDQLEKAKKSDIIVLDHVDDKKFGTVGCVALDANGNLAAGTSTGGMTNKSFGRVGDSPIIGCGTYANNQICAVSCTGHGEFFIENVVAYDVACLIDYKGLSLKEATELVINEKLKKINAEGGLIAIDKFGDISLPFNTKGMYRGYIKSDTDLFTGIY
ncbi:MAG TPA: isoaspartyl peptidase/L-asparaginase [Chitinophagales bacterium]|nr:isoaspartyl peptidase/L-asparaginase [Chitinophagales bacterium]